MSGKLEVLGVLGLVAYFNELCAEADACSVSQWKMQSQCDSAVILPAPAPTSGLPSLICFLKLSKICLRSVGGAIVVRDPS